MFINVIKVFINCKYSLMNCIISCGPHFWLQLTGLTNSTVDVHVYKYTEAKYFYLLWLARLLNPQYWIISVPQTATSYSWWWWLRGSMKMAVSNIVRANAVENENGHSLITLQKHPAVKTALICTLQQYLAVSCVSRKYFRIGGATNYQTYALKDCWC